jgi:hypothetical protein
VPNEAPTLTEIGSAILLSHGFNKRVNFAHKILGTDLPHIRNEIQQQKMKRSAMLALVFIDLPRLLASGPAVSRNIPAQ